MPDCLLCGEDRRDCSCFGQVEADEPTREPRERELLKIGVLDATDVLNGVPGFPNFF